MPDLASLRQQVITDAQGAMRLHLAQIGLTTGLFQALRDGPRTASELAACADQDGAYVARWADAAFAFGLLLRAGDALSLSELGTAFLPDQPGTLMPVALGALLSAHMAERAGELMRTGERPGERVIAECKSVLPWFGPMLEASFGPVFESQVLPRLAVLEELGERGWLAVDLGCGNGWYLRRLVARFPRLRGVGLDMVPANIAAARAAAEQAGLADRLSFHEGDIHHFTVEEPAVLVVMNRALHHVWGKGPDGVMAALRAHLAPGGALVFWEPRWPDDTALLAGDPRRRAMAFQNLSEHIQGNRFLRPLEVQEALERAGLRAETLTFAEDTEMLVVGRMPAAPALGASS